MRHHKIKGGKKRKLKTFSSKKKIFCYCSTYWYGTLLIRCHKGRVGILPFTSSHISALRAVLSWLARLDQGRNVARTARHVHDVSVRQLGHYFGLRPVLTLPARPFSQAVRAARTERIQRSRVFWFGFKFRFYFVRGEGAGGGQERERWLGVEKVEDRTRAKIESGKRSRR